MAFHEDFLNLIGRGAKLEMAHQFTGTDAQHVHEAPVYVRETNELVFADTSVVGWLWALDIDKHQVRIWNALSEQMELITPCLARYEKSTPTRLLRM